MRGFKLCRPMVMFLLAAALLALGGCFEMTQEMTIFPDGRMQVNIEAKGRGEAGFQLEHALAAGGGPLYRIDMGHRNRDVQARLKGQIAPLSQHYQALAALYPRGLAPRGSLLIRNYLVCKIYSFTEINPPRTASEEMPPGLPEPLVQKRLQMPGRLLSDNGAQRGQNWVVWVLTLQKLSRGYTLHATSIVYSWPGIMAAVVIITGGGCWLALWRAGSRRNYTGRRTEAVSIPPPPPPLEAEVDPAGLFHNSPYDDRK